MNRTLLAALLLASAQAPLGSTLVAVALPEIANGLHSDTVHATTLLVASYLVITVLFQGPGGRLSDAIGHARTLWIGIALFGLGSVAGFLSPSVWVLALARSTTAIGGALVVPSTMALLRLLVQPELRGRVFGTFGAMMALSAALGPVIGGVVVELFGWRAIFLVSLPFLILASLLLRIHPLPAPTEATAGAGVLRTLDLAGLAMLFAALVLIIGSAQVDSAWRVAGLLAGLAIGVGFVCSAMAGNCAGSRPTPPSRSRNGSGDLHHGAAEFRHVWSTVPIPAFFEHFRHTTAREVGFGLFTMMIGMVVAAPLGGRATDQFGAQIAGMTGAAALLAGSLALCRITSLASPADAMVFLILFGIGMGASSAPAQSSAMAAVTPNQAGMAAGLSSTMRYLGGIATSRSRLRCSEGTRPPPRDAIR